MLTYAACNDKPELEPIDMRLDCYPNPVLYNFHIRVNNTVGKTYTIKVFDPAASTILDESDNLTVGNYSVSLIGRPKGTYQAVLQIDNVTLTRKLTKYEE